jgi:hypothetical protein
MSELQFEQNRILTMKQILEWFYKRKSSFFDSFSSNDANKVYKIVYKEEVIRVSFNLPDLELREVDGLGNSGFDFGVRDKYGLLGGSIDENGIVTNIYDMGKAGNLGQGSTFYEEIFYEG